MLARLQQFITFALVGAAMLWAACLFYLGHPAWALIGSMAILWGFTLVLALEFVAMSFVRAGELVSCRRDGQILRAWWHELVTAACIFFWRQPFRAHASPDFVSASRFGLRGVILVHGLACNRGLWNPWMKQLRAMHVPHIAVNLEPVWGSIDDYPLALDNAVSRLTAVTGKTPVIVAHSMGGLVTRAWLDEFKADARAHRIITVGTPHHGTWLARFARAPCGRQMRIGSAWLRQLEARESERGYARFTCFFSHCDNAVFPASMATLPGADNRRVPGAAHLHMLFDETVFNEVCRWVVVPPNRQGEM